MSSKPFLLRYTSLASLLDTLFEKRIVLRDPGSWEDGNDSYCLDLFKERRRLKTVLALCLSETNETFHHWKVFAGNMSGVCIEFDKDSFLNHFTNADNLVVRKVRYRKIRDLQSSFGPPRESTLPFLKRHPFRDEKEIRIIYWSEEEEIDSKAFPIRLSCINQVLLSPLLLSEVADSVKSVVRKIEGCESLRIARSTLIDNPQWKSLVRGKNRP